MNHRGPLSIRIESSKPSRNQNERYNRSSCLSSFQPCFSLRATAFFSLKKRQEQVKRLEGADVRHLPAFISFYPPLTDWRRSSDDIVNDVKSLFRYASADSLCQDHPDILFKYMAGTYRKVYIVCKYNLLLYTTCFNFFGSLYIRKSIINLSSIRFIQNIF